MKKIFSALLMSAVFLFSSGFGAVENNSYVQSEVQDMESSNGLKVSESEEQSQLLISEKALEETLLLQPSKSLSEKLGGFLVESFISVLKCVSTFIINLIQ